MLASDPTRTARKGKFRHVASCLLPQMLIGLLVLGIWRGGFWLMPLTVFLMVLVPILDLLTGWQDDEHFETSDFSRAQVVLLRWNTRLYAVGYMAALVYVVLNIDRFSGLEFGLLVSGMGLVGGVGFGCAHELLHAPGRIDQMLQKIMTVFLFYPHYKLIHIRSHHHHAGTDHDENTAWMNESIYSYIFRTIPGSMVRCWQMEAKRHRAVSRESFLKGFLMNKMVPYALGQVILLVALWVFAGPMGLLFYAAQLVVGHLILESVNYIQHYGLLRKLRDGKYERTGPEHSWDTYHFFSSYVTFRVGHHSYHHIAVQPYYLLDPEPEAPKLPVGYFWAIPIVLLPPVWRRWINPRIEAAGEQIEAAAG